ncbi:response regulator [Candidatus Uabimicrobium amorphum]|uniref:DNA-binding response regulator n=1 Tax=Uabimicrobium amorphum TaxID=2596890 RepID=A0A5S9F609_UABAM|nr:response regulator [Candidatus Uabimicrobium amorphum]BBM86881.1 DNA-binding response regulator [Candidatus Uabimicrobium amorphum]
MKILYVENNPSFADVVCKCFLKNYNVTIVPTVQGAKELIAKSNFDILLVDYDLDDGKGNEFIAYAKKQKHQSFIIAVSSHKEGNERLKAAGANCICAKAQFDHITEIIDYVASDQLHRIQDYQTDFRR